MRLAAMIIVGMLLAFGLGVKAAGRHDQHPSQPTLLPVPSCGIPGNCGDSGIPGL